MRNGTTKLRSIIVDDEPLAIERLEILYADQDEIDLIGTANDGAGALRVAQQLNPDLIFLDIGMPKMDGISAARALALLDKKPAIILILNFFSLKKRKRFFLTDLYSYGHLKIN